MPILEYQCDQPSSLVTVKPGGQVIVDTGNAAYDINTFYSYPEAPVASSIANQLSSATGGSEAGWPPQVTETAPTTIEVAAQGAYYSLLRRIQLLQNEQGCQIDFEDRLRNLRAKPTGIFTHYAIIAAQPFAPLRLLSVQSPLVSSEQRALLPPLLIRVV